MGARAMRSVLGMLNILYSQIDVHNVHCTDILVEKRLNTIFLDLEPSILSYKNNKKADFWKDDQPIMIRDILSVHASCMMLLLHILNPLSYHRVIYKGY